MTPLDITRFGSLQDITYFFRSENPLEEVWDHVGRFGTKFIENEDFFKPANQEINWNEYLKYTQIRVRQAIEFRKAAKTVSLLTSPLPLYYSFLNLLRGFMAFGPEIIPDKGHGLKFHGAENILDSYVTLTKGTFSDYLQAENIKWNKGDSITLIDTLKSIIELDYDYRFITKQNINVAQVSIRAKMRGPVTLSFFNISLENFDQRWQQLFPSLSGSCNYENGNTLVHKDLTLGQNEEGLHKFVRDNFLPPLILQDHPTWYIFPQSDLLQLNRISYYFIGLFILGSVVRYEPELIMSLIAENSETSWLLHRFIGHAERFFPQLILMNQYGREIYFSGSATG